MPEPKPERVPVMEALIQLARPLLLPPEGGNGMDKLRAAVDLALDSDFRKARHAYFTWFRNFIEPLRSGDPNRVVSSLDPGSLALAQEQLNQLWAEELAIAKRADRSRWGSGVEVGCVTVALGPLRSLIAEFAFLRAEADAGSVFSTTNAEMPRLPAYGSVTAITA
jgi:hypothetical protein